MCIRGLHCMYGQNTEEYIQRTPKSGKEYVLEKLEHMNIFPFYMTHPSLIAS